MELVGSNGTFTVKDGRLEISRKNAGFLTRWNLGVQGEKSIPLNQITAVQLLKPGKTTGYLRLSINGRDPVGGVMEAVKDGNALLLAPTHYAEAEKMRDFLVANIGRATETSAAPTSTADEIAKLADLMKQGHLTLDEFNAKKRQLLGI